MKVTMGADFMNRRGLNCDYCGFPKDTPQRAHDFIHQQGEALIEYRKEIARLTAIVEQYSQFTQPKE